MLKPVRVRPYVTYSGQYTSTQLSQYYALYTAQSYRLATVRLGIYCTDTVSVESDSHLTSDNWQQSAWLVATARRTAVATVRTTARFAEYSFIRQISMDAPTCALAVLLHVHLIYFLIYIY